MAETTEQLRQDIAETRADLGERIDELAARAEQVVDVRHRVRERPWSSLAVAVALGFVLGHRRRRPETGTPTANGATEANGHRRFGDWLAGEMDLLATAAGMTVLGLLRDTIREETPTMATYLDRVVDEHRRR